MLQIIPQDVVLERLDQLPFELRERLLSPEFGSLVREICSLHHLDDRKADLVLTLAGDVLFGFSYIQDFSRTLAEEVPVDQRLAVTISQEIREKLFAPVEEEIKKHYKPYVEPLVSRPLQETAGAGKKLPIALESERQGERPSVFQKEEGGKQKIVINPALLRMQSEDTRYKKQETRGKKQEIEKQDESGVSKPFVLFEQKGAEALRQAQGRRGKGFSMPFGFFKGGGSRPAPVSTSRDAIQARVEVGEGGATQKMRIHANDANKTSVEQKPRVVHYSGERTQVTPFAHEEDIFRVKDSKNVTMINDHDDDTRTMAKDDDHNNNDNNSLGEKRTDVKLTIEKPAAEGTVRVKKNPFAFPGSEEKTKKDGKPRLEGNTVHL